MRMRSVGLCQTDQVRALRIGQGQRLFDKDVFPGFERLLARARSGSRLVWR